MSNRLKGAKIHPANKLSNKEIGYNSMIRGIINLNFFGKHVGSKPMRVLKLRINN